MNDTFMNFLKKSAVICLLFGLFLFTSTILTGCNKKQPKTAEEHLKLAQGLIKAGNFSQAYTHLSKALELNPKDPDIHENLSWLYLFTGRTEQANDEFRELKKLRPDGAGTYHLNGALLANLEQYRNAIRFYEKAQSEGLNTPNLYYDMAQSHLALNHDADALLLLNEGLALVPADDAGTQVNFLTSICLANYHLEKLDEAKNFCQLALDITPSEEEQNNINHLLQNIALLRVMENGVPESETTVDISEYIKTEDEVPEGETVDTYE